MEHLFEFIWSASQEYRDILWAIVVAGVLLYYKNKNVCEASRNSVCPEHEDMIKQDKSIKTHIVNNHQSMKKSLLNVHNAQKWIIAHVYRLCEKNGIDILPEPKDE